MDITWTLVADASQARVFETRQSREDFREVETLAHCALGAAPSEGASKRRGSLTGSALAAAELFSQSVCRFVDQAREQGRFTRLRVVAPPRMLGLLRRDLGERSQETVSDEIPKDLSGLPPAEIRHFVTSYGSALG